MKPAGYRFRSLPGVYAVCRLTAGSPTPSWAKGEFVSVTSTSDEFSIVCPADQIPAEIIAERDWRVLKLVGRFPFSAVGVLASFAGPLAEARISLLTVGTFDTDYLLVKESSLAAALMALARAGHQLME